MRGKNTQRGRLKFFTKAQENIEVIEIFLPKIKFAFCILVKGILLKRSQDSPENYKA